MTSHFNQVKITQVTWSQAQNDLRGIRTEVFIDEQYVPIDLEWAAWETAGASHEYFANALSQATLKRERADLADVETRISQLRALNKPQHNIRVGFKKPWVGQDGHIVSMP